MEEQAEGEPLLGTSTLRGILLLGGVAAVAFIAYKFWRNYKSSSPVATAKPIRVPIELPLQRVKKPVK